MTSDMLQSSMLSSPDFCLYINGLDENVGGRISKFSDDTKLLA